MFDLIKIIFLMLSVLVGWQCWMFPVRVTAMECQKGRARDRERERERCQGSHGDCQPCHEPSNLPQTWPGAGPAKLGVKLQLARRNRDGITVPRPPGSSSTILEMRDFTFNLILPSQRPRLMVLSEISIREEMGSF